MGHLSTRLRRAPSFVIAPALAASLLALPTVDTAPTPTPVEPELATVDLDGVESASAASADMPDEVHDDHAEHAEHAEGEHDGHADDLEVAATIEPTDTDPYRLVAVTWDDPDVQVDELEAWIRYRSDDAWSDWYPLPSSDGHAPDPGSTEEAEQRDGTEPLVVPESDGVQVRVDTEEGTEVDDLRVDLIDPGVSPADASAGSTAPSSAEAATQPRIYTRAEWGADERLRGRTVEYGQIQAGFVHHTVNTNDYQPEDVPAIIRGIYAFHVKSRGYRDVGYNFLIDKWGRIWEGRYGGIDKPVTGAHTYGHNDDAFAASTIGTYTDTEPTAATLDAYARLFAWKFDMHGVDPLSTVYLDGARVNAISGHRDTFATECPGARLYAKLPQIRTATAGYMSRSTTSRTVVMDAVPAVSVKGAPVTLRGTTTGVPTGTPASVQRRVSGATSWTTVRRDSVGADGSVSFSVAPNSLRTFDFRIAVAIRPEALSRIATVRVTAGGGQTPVSPKLTVSDLPATSTKRAPLDVDVSTDGVALGTPVSLQRRVTGQSAWSTVRSSSIAADGTASYSVAPNTVRSFDFRVVLGTSPALTSPTQTVRIIPTAAVPATATPTLTVSKLPETIAKGTTVSLTARATGAKPGTRIEVQRRVGTGAWSTVRTADLSAAGDASFTVRPNSRRTFSFRVVLGTNPTVTSSAQTMTVLASPTTAPRPPSAGGSYIPASSDVFARPADGVFDIVGHGWGHGRGLSQWGARQAADEGARESQITSFYYPGTSRSSSIANPTIRVLLTADTGSDVIVRPEAGLRVAYRAQSGTQRSMVLPSTVNGCAVGWWRALATRSDIAIEALCGQSWRPWRGTAQVDGSTAVVFAAPDDIVDVARRQSSGFDRRAYRGSIEAYRSGNTLSAVNAVGIEKYLRSVVPNEMPSSWPQEALRAQAVAARTYALREAEDRGGSFDVYDTTASQVYPGARAYDSSWRVVRTYESATTDAAVAATSGLHLRHDGRPAFTQFSSSNGGVTAAGTQPYLTRRSDGWDRAATANSRLNWTDSVSVGSLERAYPQVGRLLRIRVLDREGLGDWGGRILTMRLEGTGGSVTIAGDSRVRSALGTNSSYLTLR